MAAMLAAQNRIGPAPKSKGQTLTNAKTKKNNIPNERLDDPFIISSRSSVSCVVDTNSKFLCGQQGTGFRWDITRYFLLNI